jgi:phosphoglycerate dehydrogenase-like enzyme
VLAPALTGATRGLVGAEQLRLMGAECWLVNVGRGQLVDTPALVSALRKGEIAGAALDVTEPEPLPTGHPLWALSNCLVTPHTANPPELERRGLLERVAANVHSFALGEPLIGGVEPAIGY